ncbi:MAG: hypothetical protein RRY76_01165, partial [Clostridia bacterium]
MAKYTKTQLKRTLIFTIVACLLVAASSVTIWAVSFLNSNKLFTDKSFVKSLADSLDISARDITQETLDKYEYFRYSFHTYDDKSAELYPYVILGTKEY